MSDSWLGGIVVVMLIIIVFAVIFIALLTVNFFTTVEPVYIVPRYHQSLGLGGLSGYPTATDPVVAATTLSYKLKFNITGSRAAWQATATDGALLYNVGNRVLIGTPPEGANTTYEYFQEYITIPGTNTVMVSRGSVVTIEPIENVTEADHVRWLFVPANRLV